MQVFVDKYVFLSFITLTSKDLEELEKSSGLIQKGALICS